MLGRADVERFKLHSTISLTSGTNVSVDLFAHRYPDSPSLRWELRYVLPAIGLHHTPRSTAPHVRVKDSWNTWVSLFNRTGLTPTEAHLGRPLQHYVHKNVADSFESDASEEMWVSTGGLLVLFLFWRVNRRRLDDKERTFLASESFISRALDVDAARSIVILEPDSNQKLLCTQPPMQD